MRQLIVRDLDEEVVRRLKARAAQHGRSAEAEHRDILRQVLIGPRPRKTLKQAILSMPDVGEDADFARAPDRPRRVRLS